MKRSANVHSALRSAAILAAGVVLFAAPVAGQLARPRQAAPDAPKLLVFPFERDGADSVLSLLVADGMRDRLRSNHLAKFNTIPRTIMNENLLQSGFPVDVPLDPGIERQLTRFLNARYTIDATLIRQGADSLLVVARLQETVLRDPQSATATTVVARARSGGSTGSQLADKLVSGFDSFDEVQECRRFVDQHNYPRAIQKAQDALRQNPSSSSAYVCWASALSAQSLPQDTVLGILLRAASVDSLNSLVLRQLAGIYEQRHDTANLIHYLSRILRIDVRENELRVGLAQLFASRSMLDSALGVIDTGLVISPSAVELLKTKAIVLGAMSRWGDGASAMEAVAAVDSQNIDSLFAFRIVNYLRQAPDSARLLTWLRVITYRLPLESLYWYQLADLAYARGDTAGAVQSQREFVRLQPASMRGQLALARYLMGAGMMDSALVHLDTATTDSVLRPFAAPLYLQAGLQSYRDSNWTVAEQRLQRARNYAEGRAVVPAAFFLGLSQVQLGVRADSAAQAGRDCEAARRSQTLWTNAEQNIIAGAAQNREAANNLLTQVIPAYKTRAETMIRQYCR
jgi:hypothetical protein